VIRHYLNVGQNKKNYQIMMGDYLICNCMDFVAMMASSLGGQDK
jgi:hypothetical protein